MDKVDSRQEQKGIINRHGNPKKKEKKILEAKHCNSKRNCFSFNNTLDITDERISEFEDTSIEIDISIETQSRGGLNKFFETPLLY